MRDSFSIHDVNKWNWIDLVDTTFKIFVIPGSTSPFLAHFQPFQSDIPGRAFDGRVTLSALVTTKYIHSVTLVYYLIYLWNTCILSDISLSHLYTIQYLSVTLVYYPISLWHTCILSDISLAHLYTIWRFSVKLVYYLISLSHLYTLSVTLV